ncbi:MAG: 6,7-dimethyl-8-ribityllumazine synthase [Porticoccaceae bacterium]|nr:6,7-dimethyl-8-ribityllumazine synthase [Porticoccaceae bacterium]
MSEYRPDEGSFNAGEARIAITVARWNGEITEGLLNGARRALARHGFDEHNLEVFRVPGAFELPLATQKILATSRFDAVLALGCVIRGDTPHFDYVCAETTRGLGQVALNEGRVVAFGLLTTDTLEQAQRRSADNEENKGEEAALTALEMLTLFREL